MIPLSDFPAIDAALNGTSALLLTLGYFFIRRKKIRAQGLHAFGVCSLLAFSRLLYLVPRLPRCHPFPRQGAVRIFYLTLLGSHTILAVVIVPLVLITLYRAWRGLFVRHKKVARWTLPLWFYVSVTGVVVYWMLYQLYPQVATPIRYACSTSV